MSNCVFCNYNSTEIIAENRVAFAILDKFPVNEGHTLIISKRHFNSFFEATEEEVKGIYSLMHEVKEMLDIQYEPTGYNVGVNIGYDAGQTIMHLHIHLIPRYKGDVENPRGGIRKLKTPLVECDG
ncbi:HIT family protein [Clostridium botulinum]|uniref:Hit family protein n=1 Tax=Clostridium botulinum (strain Hall / ATCC 3502 / NCTC 13319 / Type A) TaxID=441771 RepID=A5I340_CLOBH|nr:HIT family protein [Clostridium botulinum]ABS32394.1 HIT family protein [Clostridium botulinum A str. ATCC 19397]ABS36132.1 HIT family protein [Clostridium botulinum A str. Hall]AWB17788.1 HIT family protein [Clostridium botulinum]AWB30574.1 HIT family protein [Clostridium botulinum]EGT5614571.1 HIT family protein [Clostridium botulinum]